MKIVNDKKSRMAYSRYSVFGADNIKLQGISM